jgi:hypothetical protein
MRWPFEGETAIAYLHHTTAVEFMSALRAKEFDHGACAATVIARPDPQLGKTVFSLHLDAEFPFNGASLEHLMEPRGPNAT